MTLDIAQLFGIGSFIIGVYAFTLKNDEHLKVGMACLFLSQIIHFYLMGSVNSTIASVLSFSRTVVSIKYSHSYLGVIFIILNILWGATVMHAPIDVLPILGACIGTYGLFYLSGINMRLAFLLGSICWILNNIYIGSIGGVLLESLVIVVNLLTIYRLSKD